MAQDPIAVAVGPLGLLGPLRLLKPRLRLRPYLPGYASGRPHQRLRQLNLDRLRLGLCTGRLNGALSLHLRAPFVGLPLLGGQRVARAERGYQQRQQEQRLEAQLEPAAVSGHGNVAFDVGSSAKSASFSTLSRRIVRSV